MHHMRFEINFQSCSYKGQYSKRFGNAIYRKIITASVVQQWNVLKPTMRRTRGKRGQRRPETWDLFV